MEELKVESVAGSPDHGSKVIVSRINDGWWVGNLGPNDVHLVHGDGVALVRPGNYVARNGMAYTRGTIEYAWPTKGA